LGRPLLHRLRQPCRSCRVSINAKGGLACVGGWPLCSLACPGAKSLRPAAVAQASALLWQLQSRLKLIGGLCLGWWQALLTTYLRRAEPLGMGACKQVPALLW
jgi:hypothetical protein